MATPAQVIEQAGLAKQEEHRQRQRELEDEQRKITLKTLQEDAETPEDKVAAIQAVYHKDPSVLKQHVENLTRKLTGKQTQPVVSPEQAQQARLAPIVARGKTPEQQSEEAYNARLTAGNKAAQDQATWQAGFDRQQAQQNVKDFAETYKRMTGKDVPPEVMQAMTLSQFGGDRVMSAVQQGEALKARTEYQNSTLALREAQQKLNQAKFDASQDPNNPLYRLRLRAAQTAAENAATRARTAEARYQGTWNGQPIAGDMLDNEGNIIPPVNAANVRPTGTERTRADLATSALEQTNDVLSILKSKPGMFGPGGGNITAISQWLGTSDPDAQAVRAAAGTAADHLAGVFGGRNKEALQFLREMAGGNLTMNPEAMAAGINQLNKAATTIQGKGTIHTYKPQNAPAPKKGQNNQPKVIVVSPEDMK